MELEFPFQLIGPAFMVVFAIVAFVYMRKFGVGSAQKSIAASGPMMRSFFERTGYAFPDLRGAGPDAQVPRWMQSYQASLQGSPYEVHFIRDYQGLEVHWEQFSGQRGGAFVMSQSWWAPLARLPRTPFHIAEASLAGGIGKLASEMVSNMTTDFRPAFQRQIRTGIPAIDGRFVVYGEHDDAVRALLSDPTMQQALFACSHVDLRVVPDSVRLNDPAQKNTLDMMGGSYGAMKYAGNPGAAFEVTLPVHDRMAYLLYVAATLASR